MYERWWCKGSVDYCCGRHNRCAYWIDPEEVIRRSFRNDWPLGSFLFQLPDSLLQELALRFLLG